MARNNKKSRMKGLPPKLYLQARDAHTGSYPSIVRGASDNRTGKYNVFWDDTNYLVFTSSNNINLGANVSSNLLNKKIYEKFGGDFSSSLNGTGSIVKGISDKHLSFTPGQAFKAFADHGNPASAGKSTNDPFYTTGSRIEDVGEGFTNPLWSKSKIEIDLTPSKKCSIKQVDNTGAHLRNNYPMAYWNKDKKIWEGIGDGKQFFSNYATASYTNIKPFITSASLGFAWSLQGITQSNDVAKDENHAVAIHNFGFPFAQKFHATSSNLIKMNSYIDEPFLLEKVVLHFSASLNANLFKYRTFSKFTNSITTFFILKQSNNTNVKITNANTYVSISSGVDPGPQKINKIWQIPDSGYVDSETGKIINSSRDLLSYMQISTIISTIDPIPSNWIKEITINTSPFTTVHNWNLNTQISSSFTSPLKIKSSGMYIYSTSTGSSPTDAIQISQEAFNSFRNGFGVNGKSWLNELTKPEIKNVVSGYGNDSIEILKELKNTNPYVLLPTDNLIFGWQLPIGEGLPAPGYSPNTSFLNGEGFKLEWDTAPQKITLYGSYVREGKEYHDTLNQLLTSDTVHEVIE